MDVPPYDKLMNAIMKALHHLGGSASVTELLDQVITDQGFTQEIVEQPHSEKSNQTELGYRLAWARTYLKKYDLITNSTRGCGHSLLTGTISKRWTHKPLCGLCGSSLAVNRKDGQSLPN